MRRTQKSGAAPAPYRPTPLGALVDGLILFLVLAGTTVCFSTAFFLEVRLPLVWLGCGLCALLILTVWSLPRLWWALPLASIAGLWGWGLWRMWDVLALGEISLRCSVVNTVCTSLDLDGFIQPQAQLPDEVWSAAVTLLILLAVVPLGLLLGLAVVKVRSFWLTFWCSFPFLLAPLCISVTPAWLPLMALVLGWMVLGLTSLAARRDRRGTARLSLLALPAAALLLAALTLAMPQESYQRPAWADRALDSITNWAVRVSDGWFEGDGPFGLGGGSRLADADGRVSLSDAGPLDFSGRTVLEVDADLTGRIYLRGFSGAVYDGESWQPLSDEAYASLGSAPSSLPSSGAVAGEDAVLDMDAEYSLLRGYQPMNFPALAEHSTFPDHPYARVTVRNVAADPGYVYYPYHILTQPDELSGAEFVHDSYLARAEDVWTHTVYVQPDCSPASGAQLPSDIRTPEMVYASFVSGSYMGIPDDEALQRALSAQWDGLMPFLEARYLSAGPWEGVPMELVYAQAIADYLASVAEYDPNTPVTPEGQDFVAYFLTESHRGYCMHFASSAVLLLRMLGIPARYVAGYVADVPASGHVNVPDSAAHAWVEVYLDGYGWEPVEVTPAYAGSTPGQSGGTEDEPEATPTPTPTPAATRAPAEAAPTPTPTPQAGAAALPFDLRLLLIPLAALLLVLAGLLRRALARRVREKRFQNADFNRAAIAGYLYLQRLARWGADIPAQATELAKKAKFSPHTLTQAERDAVLDAARAAGAAVDKALPWWERLLFRYLFGLY